MKIIKKKMFQRSRWKNGLGYTDQVEIFPPQADFRGGKFSWRLSTARIEMNSPFSPFLDHDRFLTVIKGEGIRLTHEISDQEQEAVELRALEVYEFPGELPSKCELLGGPVVDLSLFLQKGCFTASMKASRISGPTLWKPEAKWNFGFVATGTCRIKQNYETHSELVEEGDAIRIELDSHGTSNVGQAIFTVEPLTEIVEWVQVSIFPD